MPIFEPPTSPVPEPSETPRAPLTSSPYAALQHHELLELIDELNDERARARFREGVWIACFAHLLFFALLYFVPTWIFHGVKVINPIDAMKQHDKEIYLNLPSDVAKDLAKKQSNSSKTKTAPTQALDQKTLQQLQEMQRLAQEQAREQAQKQAQASPVPPPPPQTQAKNEPLLPLPEAPRPQQNALPDMPMPQSRATTTASNDDQFSRQIQSLAHQAIRGNGGGMNYGSGPSSGQRGVGTGMEILTDTQGVDFGPYMERLKYIIEHAWWPLMPESVYPPLRKQGVVGIRFTILKDGRLKAESAGGIVLETPSGDVALDKAAWGGITSPQPFPPLPKEFPGKELEIRGAFLYNIQPNN